MKQTGICPKCSSKKIGYLENVIHRAEVYADGKVIGHCPAPLGIERTETKVIVKVIKEGPVGQLEAYICTACGYYETYVKDPASVPYESIIGFKWVSPSD